MAQAATVERWRRRVADYQASGLTQREWTRRNEVSLSALTLWIRRLRSMTALVPIVVKESSARPGRARTVPADRSTAAVGVTDADGSIEATVGRVTVRAGSAVDPTWLATLLKSLA